MSGLVNVCVVCGDPAVAGYGDNFYCMKHYLEYIKLLHGGIG